MHRVVDFLDALRRFGQSLGPYLMIEILLPGGSLLAFMLFLYRRRKAGIGPTPRAVAAAMRLWASVVPQRRVHGAAVPCAFEARAAYHRRIPGASR